jgi:predicted CXXCH cytochrome family protein
VHARRRGRLATGLLLVALLAPACTATSRYRVLSTLFDGVPAPGAAAAGEAATSAATGPTLPAPSPGKLNEHGPYAARQCAACHVGGASNALVAPPERLCVGCHQVAADRRYVHGPIASGGCLVCHDPHSSSYPSLLVADSATFCLRCHERAALVPSPQHTDVALQCTECHEPHGSDAEYLLR